jgi:3-isopropylmalate/(R)-2-methylmalate dehydratase small subunit
MLAPSYSDIFRSNAVKSGLAPIELSEVALGELKAAVSAVNELTVDLEKLEITHPAGLRVPFELDAYARETLLYGLDDIARTLKRVDKIAAYESQAM